MADLVNIAGEGMPLHLWTEMAGEGASAWQIGRQRAQRENGGFSYRNTVVREVGHNVAAALIGYPLPDAPEAIDYSDLPESVVPLQELEYLVPGTWYINVLAAYPEHRGKGYGTGLLAIAEQLSAQERCKGLSLIVSDGNPRARQLYRRCGYRDIASRPMVKGAWENAGENWILLAKPG